MSEPSSSNRDLWIWVGGAVVVVLGVVAWLVFSTPEINPLSHQYRYGVE
jgi:hypothetical protein